MKNYLLLAVALLCLSCKDQISEAPSKNYYFTEAQPSNDSELSEFPPRFIGKYISDDSTVLNIEKKVILWESYTKFKISEKALDTLKKEFDFTGKQLVHKKTKEYYDVAARGDSLELSLKDMDTVFVFSEKAKAKKINGNIVLSRKDSDYWKVEWLGFRKGRLRSNLIFSDDDRKRVDSLMKAKAIILDSSSSILKPTRREFAKIMQLKKFGSEQAYTKIKQ
jgi:hypothetical protein